MAKTTKQNKSTVRRRTAPAAIRRRRTPVIDFHNHIIVPEISDFARSRSVSGGVGDQARVGRSSAAFQKRQNREIRPKATDPKVRLADMDRTGVDIQVLSINLSHYCYWATPDEGLWVAKMCNERIASMVDAAPDRFVGIATVPLQDVTKAVRELKRSVTALGLRGVVIGSSVGRKELGDRTFNRFWAAAQELDVPVYVHPAGATHPDRLQKHFLWNSLAQPLEEALAMSSLIYEGVLDAFPRLKICIAHGGGYLPYYAGRADKAFVERPESRLHTDRNPSAYMRRFYYDTVVFNTDMLEFLVHKVGAGRIVMGTDYPLNMGEHDPVGFVTRSRRLSSETTERILWRNAARMLKLRL